MDVQKGNKRSLGLLFLAAALAVSGCRRPTPAARGRTVFEEKCAACHSTGGDRKSGSGLGGIFGWRALGNGQDMNERSLRQLIRKGAPGMPAFAHLTARQMDDLMAYLKKL